MKNISKKIVKQTKKDTITHPNDFVRELEEAVCIFDRNLAQEVCNRLVAYLRSNIAPYPLSDSNKILGILRRKRYFDLITQVADILIQTGYEEPNICRQYAQALIDLGYISAALDVLQNLERSCIEKQDGAELAETRGLIGRAYKQIYVNGAIEERSVPALPKSLENAISAYAEVYKKDKNHIWHGINAVALGERAKRDKVTLGEILPDTKQVAEEILKQISSKEKTDLWDNATAGEACLALQDYQESLKWINKYTQETPEADAFEYASTFRQFVEVWGLTDKDKEQAPILHLLREATLRQEGGQVEIDDLEQAITTVSELKKDTQFEQILGKDRYKTFQWYCTGLDRAAGVAQILDRFGDGIGSGFLVRGSDIHQNFGEDWVVITNAHVVSDDPAEQSASPPSLPPDEVRVRFEAIDSSKLFLVKEILFSSSRSELDCTIVRLQQPLEYANPYPIAKRLPLVGKNQRVYIIGHPRGGGLSFSINDNLLLDHEQPRVHYRTPTEGGSSGSPVFDQQWDLIALHHAGGTNMKRLNSLNGFYPANEGVCLQCIRNAVATRLG